MSLMSLALGLNDTTLMVGIEDGPDGSLKVYIDARWKGIYCIIDDPVEREKARSAWGSGMHVYMARPPADCLYQDPAPSPSPVGPEEGQK